ncbi:MAG: flippase-like domain-containing protein [Desulfobacteraceae bacterium]|nr:flippase-like domain-containing protein [Desulfobacteraceae bacterium]
MYKNFLRILSVFLSFMVVVFIFYNWKDILAVYDTIEIHWVVLGFGCYVVNYIFRGVRLKLLTGSKLRFFSQAFHFSILHGFFSYLLPLRAGDISLPILLKATGKIDLKEGVGVLVKLRVMDFTMIGIFTIFGAYFGARMISSTVRGLWLLSGVVLTFFWFGFQKIGKFGNYLLKNKFKYEFDISGLLKTNLTEFFVTALIWISVYASQYCMVRSLGLDFKLSEVIFLSSIQLPLQMLPVQGVANSGNHEGGWVAALVLMGFGTKQALQFAIASHGVLVIYVALLGLLAMITGNRKVVSFFEKPMIKI